MEDFDHIKQQVLKQLHRCVVCHRQYEYGDITSVQRRPGVWTLMVECDECHSRNYIAAVTEGGTTEDAILEIRQLTRDALADASRKFLRSHKLESSDETLPDEGMPESADLVTATDVLEMHEFLEAFDGDFRKLFRSSNS